MPALMLLLAFGFVVAKKDLPKGLLLGICTVIGGGIGNVLDRLLYGKVTDFMVLGIGNLHTGIFNFADVSIMLGAGIVILATFFSSKSVSPLSSE